MIGPKLTEWVAVMAVHENNGHFCGLRVLGTELPVSVVIATHSDWGASSDVSEVCPNFVRSVSERSRQTASRRFATTTGERSAGPGKPFRECLLLHEGTTRELRGNYEGNAGKHRENAVRCTGYGHAVIAVLGNLDAQSRERRFPRGSHTPRKGRREQRGHRGELRKLEYHVATTGKVTTKPDTAVEWIKPTIQWTE